MHPAILLSAIVGLSGLVFGCSTSHQHSDDGSETAITGTSALDAKALAEARQAISFERHVKPVLESKCLPCHSGAGVSGGFSLESKRQALTRIVPGDPSASRLIAVTKVGNHREMPLVGHRLTADERKLLWDWIEQGAEWPASVALAPASAPPR